MIEVLVSTQGKNHRGFAFPNNFYLYFSFQLFNLISLKEFNETINLEIDQMQNKFREWGSTKFMEINNILDNYTDYKDSDQFQKFIKTFLFIEDGHHSFISRATQILIDYHNLVPRYFNNDDDYLIFLNELLFSEDYPIYNRAFIIKEFLQKSVRQNQEILQPKSGWQEMLLSLFDIFLEKANVYDGSVEEFYLFNDDKRYRNNSVLLNPNASERLHKFILRDNKTFESFLNFFIRSYYLPNDGNFVFFPFTEQVFGDWTAFHEELIKFQTENSEILKIKEIVLGNIENVQKSNSNQFILKGDDLNFIIQHLKSTGQLR